MLNVVCVVPVSAYEVGLSVFSGTIDVFVVVPSAALVIVDGSAIIKGDFQGRNMHVTIQTTLNSVNVYTSLTLFSFSGVLNVCYQITRKNISSKERAEEVQNSQYAAGKVTEN